MRLILALVLALVLAGPAVAQRKQQEKDPPPKPPRVETEENVATDHGAIISQIMNSELPYRDGQRLSYKDQEKKPIAFGVRRGRLIQFYDAKSGELIGKAIRQSQTFTQYWDDQGNYIGSRYNAKLTQKKQETTIAAKTGSDAQRKEALEFDAKKAVDE